MGLSVGIFLSILYLVLYQLGPRIFQKDRSLRFGDQKLPVDLNDILNPISPWLTVSVRYSIVKMRVHDLDLVQCVCLMPSRLVFVFAPWIRFGFFLTANLEFHQVLNSTSDFNLMCRPRFSPYRHRLHTLQIKIKRQKYKKYWEHKKTGESK